jgi:ADP-heptose:LPS heptosyltransferase
LKLPFEWHSLQKEHREADQRFLTTYTEIHQHHDDLQDFSDTAALIECMDLVITVDTSVAHASGSMGKPVWILLPFMPDYRWMLDREDCPWYPSARLFRQDEFRNWSSVLSSLAKELW